ncbi:transcriptional regulator, partial [Mesorhizobium sp. M7A.F.Ca.US.003.02.2.1]
MRYCKRDAQEGTFLLPRHPHRSE